MTLCSNVLDISTGQFVCQTCGARVPMPSRRECPSNGPVRDLMLGRNTDCPHRGPVIATITGRVAGCGCSGSTVEVYQCTHPAINEPVIKQGKPPCLDMLREKVPRATGRTCRECKVLRQWTPRLSGQRLRVGMLTPALMFGGAERWVVAIACGLDRSRIDVSGVAVRDAGHVFPAIVDTLKGRCAVTEGRDSFTMLAAQSDVLIAWGLTDLSAIDGFPGRVVMVSHGHCNWTMNAVRKCEPYLTDWTAVSRHAATSFSDLSRVTVVHNGIDTDRCNAGRSRNEMRSVWKLQPDEIAVGYVGRFSGEKRPLGAVEAVRELGPPYRAVLVGGGPHTEYWLKEARQILPDAIYQPAVENVGEIYRALDCFVLVSPAEGFSLALAEAWYCGCPTVSTPVGATEVMEEHGKLSVIVPVGASPQELAAAVRDAIAADNRQTVERAARIVAEHYIAEHMCRRWEQYLLALPEGRP